MSYLTTEIPTVDLRSAITGVMRRWWVMVIVSFAVLGLVVAQDSKLFQSDKGTLSVVERKYEGLIETDELGLVSIEPSTIVPVPSLDNQMAILTSPETLDELRSSTGTNSIVEVTRSEPKFTIIESVDDLNNRVSFLSTGTPQYSFKCFDESTDDCDKILDSFVDRTIELRKESVLGGLQTAHQLTIRLINKLQDRLSESILTSGERIAQESVLASLLTKRDALEGAVASVTGEMLLISENSGPVSTPTEKVSRSTIGFGLGLGLVLGLLLALQLAVLDKRIRYRWHISRIDERLPILGSSRPRSDEIQAKAIAAAILSSHTSGTTSFLILCLHESLTKFAETVIGLTAGVDAQVLASLDDATVHALVGDGSRGAVILIKAGLSTRDDVTESVAILTSSGIQLIGLSLVD